MSCSGEGCCIGVVDLCILDDDLLLLLFLLCLLLLLFVVSADVVAVVDCNEDIICKSDDFDIIRVVRLLC